MSTETPTPRDRAIARGAFALFCLTRTGKAVSDPTRTWKRLCADGDRPYHDQAEAVILAAGYVLPSLCGCPEADETYAQLEREYDQICGRVTALRVRCDEKEADTGNRRTHGGHLLPAILTTDEVRALLDGNTTEASDGS